ncbi:MAG: CPBP family intramembrane glutamic endopeptidase [Candidatus Sulfotelmatobacter sp.]|jgi:membrane protease YdiL (CAAX protease family)
MAKWNWRSLLLFEAIVSSISLLFSIAGSVSRQIVVTVPVSGGLSVGSNTILFLLGSFLPGVVLLLMSRECRSATFRLKASFVVYVNAALIGFVLPFSSYLGARVSYLPWNPSTLPSLIRVFAINLPLSPLWEEIIWRAYFFPKVNSIMRRGPSIVVAALGWTVWHAGYLFQLHHSGIRAAIITIFVVQIFLGGIVLCSIFALGRNSLLPCVLLHTAFNASSAAYFGSYNRVNDQGSYIAETIFTLVVAIVVFRVALRRAGDASALIASIAVSA